MHNYSVTVSRESDRDWISFPFLFEATIPLSADDMWQEVSRAYTDGESAWMWPRQYSQPSIDTAAPREGSRLVLTYQIPNPNNPGGPKKHATYEFDILEWHNDTRRYRYEATDSHPFLRGGGTVTVSEIGPRLCRLRWEGLYRHVATDSRSEAQGDVFAYFLGMFFTALAQNVKKKLGFATDAAA